MKYLMLTRIDTVDFTPTGEFVRIRPDRIDIVSDEKFDRMIACCDAFVTDTGGNRADCPAEGHQFVERTVTYTMVYIQGRRNPWAVAESSSDIIRRMDVWARSGRFSDLDDEDYESR